MKSVYNTGLNSLIHCLQYNFGPEMPTVQLGPEMDRWRVADISTVAGEEFYAVLWLVPYRGALERGVDCQAAMRYTYVCINTSHTVLAQQNTAISHLR